MSSHSFSLSPPCPLSHSLSVSDVPMCAGVRAYVWKPVVWLQVSSLFTGCFICWGDVSHWTWNSLTHLVSLVSLTQDLLSQPHKDWDHTLPLPWPSDFYLGSEDQNFGPHPSIVNAFIHWAISSVLFCQFSFGFLVFFISQRFLRPIYSSLTAYWSLLYQNRWM